MLLEFCKKCGKCCDIIKEMPLFLSEKEYADLKNKGYKFETCPTDQGHVITECPFTSEKGCILSKEIKPLDCDMFPLMFIYKNKQWEFYDNLLNEFDNVSSGFVNCSVLIYVLINIVNDNINIVIPK